MSKVILFSFFNSFLAPSLARREKLSPASKLDPHGEDWQLRANPAISLTGCTGVRLVSIAQMPLSCTAIFSSQMLRMLSGICPINFDVFPQGFCSLSIWVILGCAHWKTQVPDGQILLPTLQLHLVNQQSLCKSERQLCGGSPSAQENQ